MEKVLEKRCALLLNKLKQHDQDTYEHCVRVADIVVQIADRYGIDPDLWNNLRIAGLLHDVGKLWISATILDKPGKLTADEYETIKTHTTLGYTLLQRVGFPESICEVALNHHERPDGTGYFGKTEVSLFSRIVCAADCMDVMLHGRSYKKKKSPDEIRKDLRENTPGQFDPDVADACMDVFAPER